MDRWGAISPWSFNRREPFWPWEHPGSGLFWSGQDPMSGWLIFLSPLRAPRLAERPPLPRLDVLRHAYFPPRQGRYVDVLA